MNATQILIVGSGPAGYTAALYLSRGGFSPVLLTGPIMGGQLIQTSEIENFPGFPDGIPGFDLMEHMKKQALRFGTIIQQETLKDIDVSQRPFICNTDKQAYQADAVVIATGASAKWLGIPGESEFKGFGVSGCATCDGFFFRNQDVAVVGGGNTALSDALYLSRHARKVTLIHRRDTFRAEKILVQRAYKAPNIDMVFDSIVQEIVGTQSPKQVTGIRCKNLKTQKASFFETQGIFVAIGHAPQTSFLQGKVDLNEAGYILKKGTSTSVPGIFAAGDCADPIYRQAVTAAASGCQAAMDCQTFLEKS